MLEVLLVGQGWESVLEALDGSYHQVCGRLVDAVESVEGEFVVVARGQVAEVKPGCLGIIVLGNVEGYDERDGVPTLHVKFSRTRDGSTLLNKNEASAFAHVIWKFAWVRSTARRFVVRDVRIVRRLDIPFRKEIIVRGKELSLRKVAWVRIDVGVNRNSGIASKFGSGIGEISPLDEYHLHSIEDSCEEVEEIVKRQLVGTELLASDLDLRSGGMKQLFLRLFPDRIGRATQMGIECALIHAITSLSGISLLDGLLALCGSFCSFAIVEDDWMFVELNGIIPRSEESTQMDDKLIRKLVGNFKSLKIKIGGASVNDDARFVCKIANLIDPNLNTKLRLDANQAWTIEEYARFCVQVKGVQSQVDYMEEPLQNPLDLRRLPSSSKGLLKIALDESLIDCRHQVLSRLSYPDDYQTLVVHPLFMSGLSETFDIVRKVNFDATIACAYESALGISWLALFAAVTDILRGQQRCHGLAAYTLLQDSEVFQRDCVVDDDALDIHACEKHIDDCVSSKED
eukprot:Plantae.Rhodophyta-Hildenbrandia_rubra.ctg8641.p1 GENE.Plantae.Rhodophyta-Hildenbrandia_rubra.ctg8641~~Plantae.Rhodophyta-Hildenbrandia_rubra.ctg8641.p1  ORF type:complete len:515 (-),score=71.79 Plantae.Rhodophyta-Hildenbrandia_rubra.ctg8641:1429-2973(-)